MKKIAIEEVKYLLRQKKIMEGIEKLSIDIETISKEIDLSRKPKENLDEFNQIINLLNESIELEDIIRICDIVEYILKPFYLRLKSV